MSRKNLQTDQRAKSVGTAKRGDGLRILGKLKKPVELKISEKAKFKIQPTVLEGLAMRLNLSGPFLKKHNIDQLHSQDCVQIGEEKFPLLAAMREEEEVAIGHPLYILQDTDLTPMSVNWVSTIGPSLPEGEEIDGIVLGDEELQNDFNVHPWTRAAVTGKADRTVRVGVMNTLGHTVRLKAGAVYGMFQPIQTPAYPYGICVLNPKEDRKEDGTRTIKDLDERAQILIDKFQLRKSPCLKTTDDLARAVATLLKYWDLFSFDGSFGKTELIQHQIKLIPGAKQPINQKYRPINPALEPDLKRQLEKWLTHKVIEKSKSPWNFALVAAPKKNGTIRWCVDYRPLNQITVKDSHPIGNIEDNLARLAESKIFSAIDGSGAFHVIELAKEDREKTAFATPWGSYQFVRMPFGLCNGPSTYARLVQLVLEGIPYNIALPYLDDTVIHSKNLEEHYDALQLVLKAHCGAGLKLQPDKCQLFQNEIEYLGHVISGEGIKPMPKYQDVVRNWPVPKTRSQIRTFLGKVGYYRRFIQNYSHVAKPLTDLLAQDEKGDKEEFDLPKEAVESFESLKQRLYQAPILAYPRFDSKEPFILDTDWSQENNAVGGVLSQVQDGKERVIAYGAKKLNKSQARYASTKGELAAAIIFMRLWRYYLQYRRFILRIDNRALLWIHTMEAPSGMIQRWLDTLANFDFQVQHRAGTKHGNADSLSRIDHLPPPDESVDIEMGERLCHLIYSLEMDWTPERIKELQQEDEDIRPVRTALLEKKPLNKMDSSAASRVGKIYQGLFDSLYLDNNGVLRYRNESFDGDNVKTTSNVVILPQSLWEPAMKRTHEAAAHMGEMATVQRAQRYVYFPGMARCAQQVVRNCADCQAKKSKTKDQRHTLVSPCQGYPFQKVCLDFVGPLPTSHRGNKYLLTAHDTFSKWLEAYPVRKADTNTVVTTLEREFFPRFGIPDQIHSDRGTPFTSDLFQQVARTLGIRATTTPAYNPKSNPVERAHRDLETALTALVKDRPQDWEKFLPHVLFALRTHRNRMTGFAPYELLFGRHPSSQLDLVFGAPTVEQDYPSHDEYVRALYHKIQAAHRWTRENLRMAVDRQR